MLPTDFPQANFTFSKPQGVKDEDCSDLRVFKGHDTEGVPVIISQWQPSKEDIEAINQGKPIYLQIMGYGMPPVSLYTENPFIPNEQEAF